MNSSTLQEMKQTRVGYRNDAYGTEVYPLREIIQFEIEELGNGDIVDFLQQSGYQLADPSTIQEIFYIIMQIAQSSIDQLFGLWLSSKKGVTEWYDGKNGMTAYQLPSDAFPISDLGEQGILWVSKIRPTQWLCQFIEESKSER